ncbi:MAG: cysteine desulfurase [Flavobacterium sp.]|nr:cysteine desulfurase [Flavobacterium sp.]
MKKVYFDNAATTAMDPRVIQEMVEVMELDFGNPSSSHGFGRQAKSKLEMARKSIAKCAGATAAEIVFTSGGTEGNNWVLQSAVRDLGIKRIISSKIEHHAVLHVLESLHKSHNIQIDFVQLDSDGAVKYADLVRLLGQEIPTLVSLMHVNNEIGTVLDLVKTSRICQQHHAYFHSDMVQSMGKLTHDFSQIPVDFAVASAHKFHGPKGVGFVYVKKGIPMQPILFGGEQEKGLRPGTESVPSIVGMARALELAYTELPQHTTAIQELKQYAYDQLLSRIPGCKLNGSLSGLHTLLNVQIPCSAKQQDMLLFQLDMKGIAVSRGSACQSGSPKPSHVLAEILSETEQMHPSLRISFSHFNTKDEIDYFIDQLNIILSN